MEQLTKKLKNALKRESVEEINEILIELGGNPKQEYLKILEHLTKECAPEIIKQIKINIVYVLGEIGKVVKLDNKNIEYLIDTYNSSDRWVRNEIILAFEKTSKNLNLNSDERIINLISMALRDEYPPIIENSLRLLINLDNISKDILKSLITILDSLESNLRNQASKVLKKHINNENELFNLLNDLDKYKMLKKNSIRTILTTFFNSITNLEPFRERILNSNWESQFKEKILKELDTYERILLSVR